MPMPNERPTPRTRAASSARRSRPKSSSVAWRRTRVLAIAFVFWAIVAALWLNLSGRKTWQSWMNFDAMTEQSGGELGEVQAGHRRAADVPPLSYLGNGRVELGEYNVRVYDAAAQATLQTEFRLEGETACGSQGSFQEFLQSNHRFFREQVAVGLRACSGGELLDPDLPLLERKLVSRVNRALGRKFLKSLDIKDYVACESYDPTDDTHVVSQAGDGRQVATP